MTTSHRRLFLIFAILIGATGLILFFQIRRAQNIVVTPQTEPIIALYASNIPPENDEQILGNPGAPLTITEFVNFNSAASREVHRLVAQFVIDHPKDARLVFKDAPENSLIFKTSEPAHYAAYCAGVQGKFWPFVDQIFADKNNWHEATLPKIAGALDLDMPRWQVCSKDPSTRQKIATSAALFKKLALKETPVIFVNNKKINLTDGVNLNELLLSFIEQ